MTVKPVYVHDCDTCVFLGTIRPRDKEDKPIDCYWCPSPSSPSLSSVIGRYGYEGSQYASSHPPSAFAEGESYYTLADRWYLYAILRATQLGLYTLTTGERT